MDMGIIKRFEVWLVALDPAKGSEVKKNRPCLVISDVAIRMNISLAKI